ncbi:c-type cytochrome [Caminibacter sp.]
MKNILLFIFSLIFITGCSVENNTNEITTSQNVTLPEKFVVNDGRFLGAQCAQCHGTNGYSVTKWDSIAGEGEFHKKNFDEYPIMDAIASGYTYDEKLTIDNWLNTLPEIEDED